MPSVGRGLITWPCNLTSTVTKPFGANLSAECGSVCDCLCVVTLEWICLQLVTRTRKKEEAIRFFCCWLHDYVSAHWVHVYDSRPITFLHDSSCQLSISTVYTSRPRLRISSCQLSTRLVHLYASLLVSTPRPLLRVSESCQLFLVLQAVYPFLPHLHASSTFACLILSTVSRPVSCLPVLSTFTLFVHFYKSRPVNIVSSCQLSKRLVHIYTPRPLLASRPVSCESSCHLCKRLVDVYTSFPVSYLHVSFCQLSTSHVHVYASRTVRCLHVSSCQFPASAMYTSRPGLSVSSCEVSKHLVLLAVHIICLVPSFTVLAESGEDNHV